MNIGTLIEEMEIEVEGLSKRGETMARIVVNPEILAGKPIIEGTRLSVEHVLGLLNSGMSHAEIIEDYPELNEECLQAVCEFDSSRRSASGRSSTSQVIRDRVVINLPTIRDNVRNATPARR